MEVLDVGKTIVISMGRGVDVFPDIMFSVDKGNIENDEYEHQFETPNAKGLLSFLLSVPENDRFLYRITEYSTKGSRNEEHWEVNNQFTDDEFIAAYRGQNWKLTIGRFVWVPARLLKRKSEVQRCIITAVVCNRRKHGGYYVLQGVTKRGKISKDERKRVYLQFYNLDQLTIDGVLCNLTVSVSRNKAQGMIA